MSVIYKDRDEPRTYTTVRRYRVPDRTFEEEDTYEKQIVIKRDREQPPRYDRDLEYRTRERDAPREVIRYERNVERAPSPPDRVREFRFEREVEREPPRHDQWDLERYTRSTEYYQPQPIVIRQQPQPIIIKEAPRQPVVLQREEPQYELVERDDAQRRRDDDDYYYERTTREVDRGPRRGGGGGEEFYDERDYRRHVDPRDSASNYADDRYSSDEDIIITRTERNGGSRDHSPHHRRHLAEGAIAGLGAAEILRQHRRKQGEEGGHRGRQLLGGAALGAVGAEALSRARSHMRSSRSRSVSSDRSKRSRRERRRRHRSKSRSRSRSRARTLAKVGTVAAVGALAAYALRNRGNKETVIVNNELPPPRRSRSRRRRSSVGSAPPPLDARDRSRSESKHRDPEHRNRRIAQAGLATAAAAGILDRVRSRSRGGKKSRSKSRTRTGVPIAAAGLGGAALAGLYERSKARKEVARDDASDSRRPRSRSRSRSRSVPYPDDEPRLRRASSDPALIEYGDDPIYPNRRYEEQPAEYRRRRRGSSASLSPDRRRHDRSSRSRSRSRSRTRGLAEGAAAAGVAAVAAHELGKQDERRRSDRDRDRQRRRREEEDEMYAHDRPYSPPPMGVNAAYPPTPQSHEFYPATNSFPPPPTDNYGHQADYPYQPYNPADYPPPPATGGAPRGRHDGRYPSPEPNLGYPPANETFAGDARYAGDDRGRPGREHVSSNAPSGFYSDPHDSSDGVNKKSVQFNVPPSEGMSSPDAQRKTNPRQADQDMDYSESDGHDDRTRTRSELSSDGTTETEHKRRRRRRHRHHDEDIDEHEHDDSHINTQHRRRRRHRSRDPSTQRRTGSPDSVNSSETVELPPRFDQEGRKVPERGEDPLADKIEDLFSGKGLAGGIFKRLTGDLLGDGGAKKRR